MRRRVLRRALPLAPVAVAAAVLAMAATAAMRPHGTVRAAKSSSFGAVLVAANGHTLYRYTADKKGVSKCNSVPACSTSWPALLVKSGSKPTAGSGTKAALLGTIPAPHGKRQVTYAGFPLYFFAGDTKAGDTNGQGVGGKWFVVSTTGGLVKHAVKAATPAASTSTGSSGGTYWG
jgi:predicted lipoprotein with Yx(FWY)xxD motif